MTDTLQTKLLLIDDDPSAHVMLKTILELPPPIKPTIMLFGSMTWEGGLHKVQEEEPDIVLLDLKLSDIMKGPQTIAAMREHLSDIVATVIITGHMEPGDEWNLPQLWREARLAGACGFLRKDRYLDPSNRAFLLHELNDAILEFGVRQTTGVIFNPSHNVISQRTA